MSNVLWIGPDGQVYTVSLLEEPWDQVRETMTIVFRCPQTGWMGATELDTSMDRNSIGMDDFAMLLKRAKAA